MAFRRVKHWNFLAFARRGSRIAFTAFTICNTLNQKFRLWRITHSQSVYVFQCPAIHNGWYPLVNVYITMERSTMLLMGTSTISTGPFSMSQTVSVPGRVHNETQWNNRSVGAGVPFSTPGPGDPVLADSVAHEGATQRAKLWCPKNWGSKKTVVEHRWVWKSLCHVVICDISEVCHQHSEWWFLMDFWWFWRSPEMR